MLNTRSFSDILATLETPETHSVNDDRSEWTGVTDHYESHLDLFALGHVIQLMTDSGLRASRKIGIQKAYPIKHQVKTAPLRPNHKLNELQIAALDVLKFHTPHIKDNFNLHELKSAYRLSVLKTHPDQGGNSESFQEVKKSYQILLALVKN